MWINWLIIMLEPFVWIHFISSYLFIIYFSSIPHQKKKKKKNQRNEKRNHGEEYTSSSGRRFLRGSWRKAVGQHVGSSVTAVPTKKKRRQFPDYWNTGNVERQRDFICRNVMLKPSKTTKCFPNKSPRQQRHLPSTWQWKKESLSKSYSSILSE